MIAYGPGCCKVTTVPISEPGNDAGLAPEPPAANVKSPAPFAPPSLLITCLTTVTFGAALSVFVSVQSAVSP